MPYTPQLFIAGNYAVMRHADYKGYGEEAEITEAGKARCETAARNLLKAIHGKKVVIFHSPLKRALLTAKLLEHALHAEGVEVESVEPLEWLKELSSPTQEMIRDVLSSDETDFMLFVSHLPQVGMLIGVDRDEKFQMQYCAIFARDFSFN